MDISIAPAHRDQASTNNTVMRNKIGGSDIQTLMASSRDLSGSANQGPLLPSLYPIHHTRIIDKLPVERLRFVRVTRIQHSRQDGRMNFNPMVGVGDHSPSAKVTASKGKAWASQYQCKT
jgi:hypothetical protein